MTEFTVGELAIPPEVGAEGWSDFVAMTDARNEIEANIVGTGELAFDAEELLPRWLDPIDRRRLFVARLDGRIVARSTYEFTDDDDIAWITVEVLDRASGQGVGSALYSFVFDVAKVQGKRTFQTEFYARVGEPGPRIPSPSGFGSVPAESVGSRFAIRRGYGLEMVLRYSRLALPVDADVLARHLAEARAAAGDDYRVIRWTGRTPELWLDDLAVLHGRMYTDAPHGDLDMGDEVWDAERQRAHDEMDAQSPRALVVSAIEHIPSSRLVAFTELTVPPERGRPIAQRDTLVLSEHRGHRLGMLLKVDNIEAVTKAYPGHPSITTTNAEENSYMLAVNEAVGFAPMAYAGVWKYVLD
jgi:GNAT superfamily N-acetyltransferase